MARFVRTTAARRRWSTRASAVIIGAVVLALALRRPEPGGEQLYGWGLGAAVVVTWALTLLWWRCEHCQRYLGGAFFPQYCPYCGEPLG